MISLVNVIKIRNFLRIWPHLLMKSLMENFFYCGVLVRNFSQIRQQVGMLKFWKLGMGATHNSMKLFCFCE